MKEGKKIAKKYLSLGLNPLPIPVNEKKPLIEEHNTVKLSEKEIDSYPFDAIGVSTGLISGSLEAIDFD